MRAFPSLDDLFDDPEEARKAFMEALEEVIDDDPFFSAFELAENPDADPDAMATALELAYPDDAPDDPDRPMPKALFVAPAVSIRRRSCGTSRRATGNGTGTGNGKGGGDGGNDGDSADSDGDSNSANPDNDTKNKARAEARAKGVRQMVATTPRQWLNERCLTLPEYVHTVNITHCIEGGGSKIDGDDDGIKNRTPALRARARFPSPQGWRWLYALGG